MAEIAAETAWLDEREMRAWRSLVGAHHDLMATLDAELVDQFGVSMSEYEVLVVLSEHEGRRMRMTVLAEWLNLSPSGLTRRLDTVVSRGWVAREKCPSDRRGTFAVLTDPGYLELQRIAPTHVASVRAHFIDRLTPEQLDALADALSEVRGACPKELAKNAQPSCSEALPLPGPPPSA